MTEEELLAFLAQNLAPHAREVICGVGDDCAVLEGGDHWLLLTVDTLVEEVHFSWRYFTPYELGRKLAAANLSDIAAMGGRPTFALLSLSAPGVEEEGIKALFEGLVSKLALHGAELIGGDVTRSPKDWVLSLTLLGRTAKGAAIFRNGANPGDLVFVSRPLGASAAALALWQQRIEPPEAFKKAHLDPEPEVELGLLLAENGLASAMIDVSDGFLLDLKRLSQASGVGAEIELARIPLAEGLKDLPLDDPYALALSGGEDFALLFTVPEDRARVLKKLSPKPLYQVGRIVPQKGLFLLEKGRKREVSPQGFDHFAP